jgi:alpha-N-arabinofuranosidase
LAEETAKAMKLVDPSVRLVACGSSGDGMPTFGQWEATVLDHTFDHVDYLSLHAYYEQLDEDEDAGSFLASAFAMDGFIDGVVATCDHIAARKRSRRKLKLSFDEWNVWYMARFSGRSTMDWEHAPRLIEDEYTVLDAVVVGNLLMSLLRHADRVGIACLAQLVNVIGPIRAESDTPAWRQTTFHPFALTARYASGDVLRVETATPNYSTTRYDDVPAVDVVATHDQDTGDTAIFAVNRLVTEPVAMRLDLRALPEQRIADHRYLGGSAFHESNTATQPDRVVPLPGSDARVDNRSLHANLPPASWTMLRLAPTTTMRPSR